MPPPRHEADDIRWWQWPTVLSLDAPAVALAWQWQFAATARVALGWPHAFVLGASTWLAYAADRWIEGWRLEPGQIRTQRHRFYQRWRWPAGIAWLVLLAADLAVARQRLTAREFETGLLLLAPVLLYLLSHQFVHRGHRWRAPKEICVAALVAGGAVVFVVAQPGAPWTALAAPLALFFLLGFANCALISAWEHEVDRAHGQTSLALQAPQSGRLVRALPWSLAAAAAIAAGCVPAAARPAAWCAAASGLLLGVLDRAEPRLGRRLARVLADAALLTPVVAALVR